MPLHSDDDLARDGLTGAPALGVAGRYRLVGLLGKGGMGEV